MRNALLRPTHLAITAILLVAGLTGVVAGTVLDADEAPTTWRLPALLPGDQATYSYAVFDDGAALGDARHMYRLHVMENSTVLDGAGLAQDVRGIQVTQWGYSRDEPTEWIEGGPRTYWYDDDVVAIDGPVVFGEPGEPGASTLGLIQTSMATDAEGYFRSYLSREDPRPWAWLASVLPCGFLNPMQGQKAAIADLATCHVPGIPATTPSKEDPAPTLQTAFHAGDADAYVVQDDGGDAMLLRMEGHPMVDVWFRADRPVPVRYVVHDDLTHVIELTSWQRTAAPKDAFDQDTSVGLPTPQPLRGGLPDRTGAELPFPFDEAWQHASEEPQVVDFLEDDTAIWHVSRLSDETWDVWDIGLSNGPEDGLKVTVTRHPPPPDEALLPIQVSEREVTVEVAVADHSRVPLDRFPTQALPIAQMLATARELGFEDRSFAWSYTVRCQLADECGEVVVDQGVTYHSDEVDSPEPGTDGITQHRYTNRSYVDFAPDGGLDSIRTSRYSITTTSSAVPASTTPAPGDEAVSPALPTPPTRFTLAAGSIGILAAVLYFFWPVAKHGVVGLFSRVRPDEALDHPTRQRIHDLINEQPGIHGHDLARAADLHRSTVDHHIRKLVDCGIVLAHRAGGYTCYFPQGTDRRVVAAAPALRSDTARSIMEAIRQAPGMTTAQAAEAAGVSRSTANHHVQRLRDAGLLDGRRDGQGVRLWVVPTTMGLVAA